MGGLAAVAGVRLRDPRNPLGVRPGLHVELLGVMNYRIVDFRKELVVPIAEYNAGAWRVPACVRWKGFFWVGRR
jgi:hypothetical protein